MEQKTEKKSIGGKVLDIIAIILCIVLSLVLIVNITIIVKSWGNPDKVPTFAGICPMVVQTDSMYPEFEGGDLIIVKEVAPEEVAEGDIISFFDPSGSGKTVVTHRVLEVTENEDGELSYRTKGDANNAEDSELVPASKLVGRYSSHVKGLGKFMMFMQTVPGIIICVLIPIVIIGIVLVIRNRKYDKKKDEETAALKEELEALRTKQKAGDVENDSVSDKEKGGE